MRRRVAVVLALLCAWSCYGLALLTLADQEAGRCHQYGDLAAECSAPFLLFFAIVTVVFLGATIALTVLALRAPSDLGKH